MFQEFWRHGSNAALAGVVIITLALDLTGLTTPHPLLCVLGAALFLASEYTYHRYAFHAPPMREIPFILMLQHRLHYDHHLEPGRLDLLFLPLWFIVPNFIITGGLAWLVWPHLACVAALLAGTSAAILYYEWVHYVAHIPYRPRSAWGRYVKKYHLWHHFKNERLWFGVTNPGGDFMLGSYAAVDGAAASGTARTLRR